MRILIILLLSTATYAQSANESGMIAMNLMEDVQIEHVQSLDFGDVTRGSQLIQPFESTAGQFNLSDIQSEFIITFDVPTHLENGTSQVPVDIYWSGAPTLNSKNGLITLTDGQAVEGIRTIYYGAGVNLLRQHTRGNYVGEVVLTIEVL